MKTLKFIECRTCGGSYFAGDVRVTLVPAVDNEPDEEVCFAIRKVARCTDCKQYEDRSKGGRKKR